MAEKQAARHRSSVPGSARGVHPIRAPDNTRKARDLQNKEGRMRAEAKEIKRLQQQAQECLNMSPNETEQRNGLRNQQADDRQNAAQNPSSAQPVVQHAFNPDAPVFVSSKVRKVTNAQTSKTESNSRPRSSASMAPQGKGSLPDRHSTSSDPSSPRIPAKMLMPSSQSASSVQEAQEASVGPTSAQHPVTSAAPPASASELICSVPLPKDGTQEANSNEGSASDAKVITDGNQAGCLEVHDVSLSSLTGNGNHDTTEAGSAADGQTFAARNARGSWLTVDDAVRTAEDTVCIRQEAEQEEQQLLGSDFETSRRVQADLDKILDITTALAAVISSDQVEDRDELNKMYIGVTAIARRTRRAKETRDAYLHDQAASRRAGKTQAVGQAQANQDDNNS